MSKSERDSITLMFDLFDLPTAQHKAGLAGLLLQIQSMNDRKLDAKRVPEVKELTRTSARIEFTRDSVQGLFDDLYEAKLVDGDYKKLKKNKKNKNQVIPPDEIRERMVKGKLEKRYIYFNDVVQPQSPCLARYLESPENNPWLKLWRDMVWEILRGGTNVRARAPFNERAKDLPCRLGDGTWGKLCKFQRKLQENQFETMTVTGALMIAAQQLNAEGVPFEERVDFGFLLHFWQTVVLVFVPQRLKKIKKNESSQGERAGDYRLEPFGYAVTIPEVIDLREFTQTFSDMLGALDTKVRRFRPAASLVDIPVQAGLEFLRSVCGLVADKAGDEEWIGGVAAIETFHLRKGGNKEKVKPKDRAEVLSFDRVANCPGLVAEYERVQKTFRNPLFRAARLRGLLRDQPWYVGMLELFTERPWTFFVENENTPKFIPRFGTDSRTQFRAIYEDTHDMSSDQMSDTERLSRIAQRLINKYVEGRAEAKTGKKAKGFPTELVKGKPRRIYPQDFREAQQRVCSDAFLSMRSRHDQDFVEYFVGSICSVAQYLPADDYQFLTSVLMRKSQKNATGLDLPCWEDVKALAMIAVSACSYATQPREPNAQQNERSNP